MILTDSELFSHPAVRVYTPWIRQKMRFSYADLARLWSQSEGKNVTTLAAKLRIRRLGIKPLRAPNIVFIESRDLAIAIIDRHNRDI